MKKKLYVGLLVILCFSIFCLVGCNPYAEKYPEVINGEVWICEETDIFFHYVKNNIVTHLGECKIGDSSIEICLLFEGPFVELDKAPIEVDGKLQLEWIRLLSGRCKFKKDRFSIKVSKDEILDNQYETLTFHRYAKDEVDWIDGWPIPKEGQS